MDLKIFECISCGHFTRFDAGTRPRCEACGGQTGIVSDNPTSPHFRTGILPREPENQPDL